MPGPIDTSPIRLVCFDLGGVLLRICRSWEEGCARAGIRVRETGATGPTLYDRNRLVIEYQTGRMTCESFFCAISESLGGAYSPDEVRAIHRAWVIEEYPGAARIVHEVHSAGLATACLSNTNPAHWARMDAYPSVMTLGARLASHELRLHKPDPAIYREAEARLNVPGHAILFFDDLPENVNAAREAGWQAEWIDPGGDTASQMRARLSERAMHLIR